MTGKELYLQLKRAGLENVPLVAANPYLDDSDPGIPGKFLLTL